MYVKVSYKTIIKSSSIFGGVQVFLIIISFIRAKFVAIFLGAIGMGISSLFVSSLSMINTFAGLGLNYSAVREISTAHEEGNYNSLSRILLIFRRWLLFSSLLGVLLTIIFASYLSEYTFGNKEYTWHFVLLSIFVFLTIFNDGNLALLRGARRIKDMAKATLIGAIIGLLSALPLYYFLGLIGIVPALIIGALSNYFISYYFARKVKTNKITLSISDSIKGGKEMAKLGITMMLASFLGALTIFLINSFISNYGSVSDVGLYQAGVNITNKYVGLIFIAMSIDFFPRLAAINSDNLKVRIMVNQQAEITILAAAPLLILMILTAPILTQILLTKEFNVIGSFIRITAIGMLFKAAATAVGYIAFAKGDKTIFFFLEGVTGNILTITGSIIGYLLAGLDGIAIGLLLIDIVFLILICFITYRKYKFYFNLTFIKLFSFFLLITISVYMVVLFCNTVNGYLIATVLAVFSFLFSYKELDKRVDIKEIVRNKIKSLKK